MRGIRYILLLAGIVFAAAAAPVLLAPVSGGVAVWADSGSGKGGDGDSGGDHGNGGGSGNSGKGSASGHDEGQDQNDDQNDDDRHQDDAAASGGAGAASGGRGGHDYVPDEVVVANLSDSATAAVRRLGFVVLDERQLAALGLKVTRLRVPRQLTAPSARTLLMARYPGVLVDLNALYRPQGQMTLPAPDYGPRLIGWPPVPASCGAHIRIGVVDTAVDIRVPALSHARVAQRSFLPAGVQPAPTDHGTAIAAILVGHDGHSAGQGLLPGAALAVAGVMAADRDGKAFADAVAVIQALDWLVGSGVPVINLSLVGDANELVGLAVRHLVAQGVVLVAAAGNGGPGAPPAFPAAEPGVIGVTAVDSASQIYADANRGAYVSFAAPGVRIWTPTMDGGGRYDTGTSFAAPFVTAAAAVEMAAGRTTAAGGVVTALAGTAIDLGTPGRDPVFGWGLIQARQPCPPATQ